MPSDYKAPGRVENLNHSKIGAAATAIETLADAIDQDLEPLEREEIGMPDTTLVVVDAEYRKPWDWDGTETAFQYKMFLHYRDQGLSRTAKATSKYFKDNPHLLHGLKVSTVNLNHLYQTSTKHNWKARVLSWDVDQEEQYQLARSEAIREMVDRHENTIVEALDSLMVPIRALSLAMEDEGFVKNLSRTDAKKLISMSNQASRTIPALMSAERLARDMPTEIVGGKIDHQHVVTVERDRIGEILEVLAGAGQFDDGGRSLGAGEVVDAEVVDVHPVPADDN